MWLCSERGRKSCNFVLKSRPVFKRTVLALFVSSSPQVKQENLNVFFCCKKLVLILAMICGRVIDFLKISTFKVFTKEL